MASPAITDQPPALTASQAVALSLLRDNYAPVTIDRYTGVAADDLYRLAAAHGITAPCGTVNGYGCHLARAEDPCWDCETAHGRAQARERARQRKSLPTSARRRLRAGRGPSGREVDPMTGTVVENCPLRGLTLWQPWATCVQRLGKDTENRPRRTNYRGLVLVHAGLKVDHEAMRRIGHDHPMPRGAVLAIARIVDAHNQCDGSCSKWAFPDVWHWQLSDVVALTEPVRASGAQGLWVPDDDLRRRVAVALPTDTPVSIAAVLRSPAGASRRRTTTTIPSPDRAKGSTQP